MLSAQTKLWWHSQRGMMQMRKGRLLLLSKARCLCLLCVLYRAEWHQPVSACARCSPHTIVLLCSNHTIATIILFLALILTQSFTHMSLTTPTALTHLCSFLPSSFHILLPALSCAFFAPHPTGMGAASQYRVAFARPSPTNSVVAAIFNPQTPTHKMIAPYGISAPLLVLWVPDSDSSSARAHERFYT